MIKLIAGLLGGNTLMAWLIVAGLGPPAPWVASIQGVSTQSEKRIAEVNGGANLRAEATQALASIVAKELTDHKLFTAQTYITRAGLREVTDQIMDAIGGLGSQITGMNERIDRMLERPATTRPRASP